ncbi:alpha-ketoglutarate-dependent dioxygenase AlkB [uncultured Kordia sp.]|uniref:alpha-ketoglutarate-dependent dioxygenase AlkB n=1 Tax=uncultured Kordia sp. TaxID=507699 RepID=UPI002632C46C|nr:alpha-ketoglutarate-dependent dioxygenase AlkB [uncultured Kordia sp.]
MIEKNGFYQFSLSLEETLFESLSNSVDFEAVGKGRKGNHLVKISDDGIPLVRTTTKYTIPAHDFSSIHNTIAGQIENTVKNTDEIPFSEISFNNALIEIYTHEYTKMKYHSDQCLDIAPTSFIALFSCYEQPNEVSKQVLRKLKVRDKTTLKEFEFLLENNSVVFFSVATNSKFQHKIVLEPVHGKQEIVPDNRWLGITFRTSKTFVHFKDELPYFSDGTLLELANEEQRRNFYMTRGEENRSMDFEYPTMKYTLSESDLMLPKKST